MIEDRIKKGLIDIGLKTDKIQKIILFGSRAICDHTTRSDLDIAIAAPDMDESEFTALTFTIEEELETLLLMDLVKFESASKEFQERINETGITLYDSEHSN